MRLAVLIPTFRRNDGLTQALRSVFAQSYPPDEIIVADNSPEAGARKVVDALQDESPCPLVYAHAPEPGVANARNAGFAATKADRIAQLDDDETAEEDWLQALVDMADQTGAAVIFGPVRAAPGTAGDDVVSQAWAERLYARTPDLCDGVIDKPWGCGNSLVDRTACALPDPVFDTQTNDIGGEDDLLFAEIAKRGGRFAWAGGAVVNEHVDPARVTRSALFRRSFAFGQGPSQTAADQHRWHGVSLWMAIGLMQAALFGPAAMLFDALKAGSPRLRAQLLDRASQAVGKLIWLNRFAPRFYGAALAKTD
jgi:glycosyltransferase involved in cell wall biosynthesis